MRARSAWVVLLLLSGSVAVLASPELGIILLIVSVIVRFGLLRISSQLRGGRRGVYTAIRAEDMAGDTDDEDEDSDTAFGQAQDGDFRGEDSRDLDLGSDHQHQEQVDVEGGWAEAGAGRSAHDKGPSALQHVVILPPPSSGSKFFDQMKTPAQTQVEIDELLSDEKLMHLLHSDPTLEAEADEAPNGWSPHPPESSLFDVTDPPPRFIAGLKSEGSNVPQERWRETVKWRQENAIDDILDEPQIYFDAIKSAYCHYLLRAQDGRVVLVHRPGVSDMTKLLTIPLPAIQRHFVFLTEAVFRVLTPDAHATMISIYDLEGIGVSDLAGATLEVFKSIGSIYQTHYVGRSAKPILVLNANWGFRLAFKAISPLLAQRTRDKISIFGGPHEYNGVLIELLGQSCLPKEYGGQLAMRESPEEALIRDHVQKFVKPRHATAK